MNLPNLLTILRIFFVPFLVAVLMQGRIRVEIHGIVITHELLALGIFLAAAAMSWAANRTASFSACAESIRAFDALSPQLLKDL